MPQGVSVFNDRVQVTLWSELIKVRENVRIPKRENIDAISIHGAGETDLFIALCVCIVKYGEVEV